MTKQHNSTLTGERPLPSDDGTLTGEQPLAINNSTLTAEQLLAINNSTLTAEQLLAINNITLTAEQLLAINNITDARQRQDIIRLTILLHGVEKPLHKPTKQPAGRAYTKFDADHSVHYRPRLSYE